MNLVIKAALLAAAWLAAAFFSRSIAHAETQTLPLWLGSGISFAALLVTPRWTWPAWLAGAGVAAVAWGAVAHQLGLVGALVFGAVEVLSVAVGAWVATAGRHDPHTPRGVALLIGGTLVVSIVGATLATAMWSWLRPAAQLAIEWRAWALSTGLGLLLVAPLFTAFRGFRVRRSGGLPMAPFLGGALAFLAFVAAVLLVFSPRAAQQWGGVAATLAYVPMPFLLVAAVLWGPRGGALATLAGALLIIARTAQGGGPFAMQEGFAGEAVIEVQGFVLAWVVVMLLTGALAEGRRSALARAHDWQLRYERTLRAVAVASVEVDAVTRRATWGEGAAQALDPAAVAARTLADWLDLVDPAERGLVQAQWEAVAQGQRAATEQQYMLRLPGGRPLRVRERLAAVQGGDGQVEQVVALIDRAAADPAHG
jgi:integral membrane sensor domain MASE1